MGTREADRTGASVTGLPVVPLREPYDPGEVCDGPGRASKRISQPRPVGAGHTGRGGRRLPRSQRPTNRFCAGGRPQGPRLATTCPAPWFVVTAEETETETAKGSAPLSSTHLEKDWGQRPSTWVPQTGERWSSPPSRREGRRAPAPFKSPTSAVYKNLNCGREDASRGHRV